MTAAVVQSIAWQGNEVISSRDLRAHILTQAPRWPRFWVDHPFHEDELAGDMGRIAALYRLHGYYETRAEYSLVYDESEMRAIVEIRIDEGVSVETKSVQIRLPDGTDPASHSLVAREAWDELLASLPLRSGKTFKLEWYRDASQKILAHFMELGFPRAQLVGGAQVDLARHEVTVEWTLELGRRIQLGEAEISGLESVEEFIVRREIRFEPGQWYSASAMAKTRRRLQNLGLFRWSAVEAEPPDASVAPDLETTWPVQIRLTERPPRRVRVGGGWGTDTSFRAELSWHHRNFFGGARHADVSLRYSGLGATIRPAFTEPYFLGTRTRLLVTPAVSYETLDSYNARRILVDVQFLRELRRAWSIRTGYSFDRSDISSVIGAPASDDDPPEGVVINTGPYVGIRRSTVADPLNARSGTSLDLTAATSLVALGSDEDFIRYILDARSFAELWNTVLAARIRLGTIQNVSNTNPEDIPLVERLYSGGSSSMRGFAYRSLGPKDTAGDSIGGSSLIESSVEWRVAIFRSLGAVAFVDAAFVGPDPFSWKLDKLRYAAGPGLRYDTPAGPIRLDFAWRLNPARDRGKFRVNVSLGHAF